MFALVFEGRVVQVESEEFPVSSALAWIDISDVTPQPEVGWSHDGVAFNTPPPDPAPPPKSDAPLTAEELAAHLVVKGAITEGEITAIKAAR